MGKQSRRKREKKVNPLERPKWAGAYGFQYAWAITERYRSESQVVIDHDYDSDDRDQTSLRASLDVATIRLDVLERQVGTLDAFYREKTNGQRPPSRGRPETVLPGKWDGHTQPRRMKQYAISINGLSIRHIDAMRKSTPILFDPSCNVPVSDYEFTDLNLPFPYVFCDFMGADGAVMPIHETKEGQQVGLIGATLVQSSEDGAIDVYPIITTNAERGGTIADRPKSLLYGMARFGGHLPEPPPGLQLVEKLGAQMWLIEMDVVEDHEFWATCWVLAPALAAAACLRLLDAVNVDLEEAVLPRPERRRAVREGAKIPLEVRVRPRSGAEGATGPSREVDWSHRWTVRGHWMHFRRGPIYNANPRKRVVDPVHGECVKVWCPPCVKGPSDKSLVLKTRRADNLPSEADSVPAPTP